MIFMVPSLCNLQETLTSCISVEIHWLLYDLHTPPNIQISVFYNFVIQMPCSVSGLCVLTPVRSRHRNQKLQGMSTWKYQSKTSWEKLCLFLGKNFENQDHAVYPFQCHLPCYILKRLSPLVWHRGNTEVTFCILGMNKKRKSCYYFCLK